MACVTSFLELANSLVDLFNKLWSCASGPLGYIYNLKDNVESLRTATDVLKEVKRRQDGGVGQHTAPVMGWLNKVQKFVTDVDQILADAEERAQIKCLRRCLPPNCCSSYKLGEGVHKKLIEAEKLQTEAGELGILTSPLPPPPVHRKPMSETVGLDFSLDDVWKWLVDEREVRTIGLYGQGGVGKTTLMNRINEKIYHENPGFEVVIWVDVSKPVNKEAIRDAMRKRLGIEDCIWSGSPPEDQIHHLCTSLTKKKFVLLIDDLWERLDLSEIGVPHGLENGSKIVFTTREKQICVQMGAEKTSFEVQCLTPQKAQELFEKYAGKLIVKSCTEIQELANKIVDECKGLPLALKIVGRVMAGVANPHEWEQVLATLRDNPHKISGMEKEVYHILELSYNRLDDSDQRCFLYCCLFPEDYRMRPHDLIGLWIGEGLLGGSNDVYGLRIKGECVLERLNRACLLERGHDDDLDERAYVKMHDVIRDMAMWIACDRRQKENRWQVIQREEDLSAKMISEWGDAEKISIWGKRITNIYQVPSRCSQLETLIVRRTGVQLVPRGFFNLMATRLTVLNLSNNIGIESFPEEICHLINLQYLNLSGTSIRELPRDIDKLIHLRWLLLESFLWGILIPIGAITNLPLNMLSLWRSWQKEEEEMVEELERMQHLADLSIDVHESSSVHKIFQSGNLQRSIRRVAIRSCFLTRILVSHSLSHLESLILRDCDDLVQIEINEGIGRAPDCSYFPRLTEVKIVDCGLSDLSCLVHAPKLRELLVRRCLMENIIGDGLAPEKLTTLRLFSCLQYVGLDRLPNLTSICNEALSFPSGVTFEISDCPSFRKLSLDSSSARERGFSVKADKYWWAGLEFEWDPAARVTFQSARGFGDSASGVEEMTYGEARRRLEDEALEVVEIGFIPLGPSEQGC